MGVLEVKNLSKKFGKFTAVDNISFSLKEGEILGLLGPNGAGKTTTLQMFLGVSTPTSGRVLYFGKDFYKNKEAVLEKVNFSSAYTNLPWRLKVWENLKWISYLYNIDDRKTRIATITEIFDLNELLNKEIGDLSAGQITRVNLAKAFINFPKILLLDEPTASLDPDVADYVRKFILGQVKKYQVSIIITSHNMSEVEEICDRVLFINNGKIIADDEPQNLAKSVSVSHIRLLVAKKEALIQFCKKENIEFMIEGRYVVLNTIESKIPHVLNNLAINNIAFDEISIDKPTLEDYFLTMATKRKI